MNKTNKLYKGKYAIGIYQKVSIDGEDTLIRLFDNVEDLAHYLNRSVSSTYAIVSQHYHSKRKDIRINNRSYELKCVCVA